MSKFDFDSGYEFRWGMLFDRGLYEEIEDIPRHFRELAVEDERYDAYCWQCEKESTVWPVRSVNRLHRTAIGNWECSDMFPDVMIRCGRVSSHRMLFHFCNGDDSIMKIGQYPSMADIACGGLGRIARVMTVADQDELSRAVGLHAHGIGVGSFVYLRRILERLVIKAEEDATVVPTQGARFVERIRLLRGRIPEFLVDNAHLHGILSKGVHEMSEEECKDEFRVVRAAIEELFEERLAELQRGEARDRTRKELNALNSKIARRESTSGEEASPG